MYEFPAKQHQPAEVLHLVKNMKQRRNAITDDSESFIEDFAEYLRDKIMEDWF